MINKEILNLIPDHPFKTLRGNYVDIKDPDKFWEIIEDESLITNMLFSPEKLMGSGRGPSRRLIKGKTFENVSFSHTEICDLTFQNCNFVNCLFAGTAFRRLRIRECSFHNCYMLQCKFEDTYVHVSSFDECLDKTKHANIGVHLYQQLMQNFKATDQPDFFKDADFSFMKWKRYQLLHDVRDKKEIPWTKGQKLKARNDIFWNYVYQKVLGYGIKLSNLSITSLVMFAFFGLLNFIFWSDLGSTIPSANGFSKIIAVGYYTVVSLSNLGYGDIVPATDCGRILASIQAVVGAIWFAIMASMLFKKFSR